MNKRTLIFEGAGWDKAEHNGVGNCRIRATFLNKCGQTIYLEITGHKPHNYSPNFVKNFDFHGFVNHCLLGGPRGERMNLEHTSIEYTKERILGLVNSIEIGGDFDEIEVKNTGWSGFFVNGKAVSRE